MRSFLTLLVILTLAAVGLCAPAYCAEAQTPSDQFSRFDKNNDSFLTPDELNRPKMFKRLDTNGDGKISREEAKAAAGSAPKAGQRNRRGDLPAPTFADVKYGPHDRNLLDFWQAKSDKPTPLVVFIHGGGFRAGDKSQAPTAALKVAMDSGVSFMSISYRFLPKTPVQDILSDCARAVQYVRANATKFNIDAKRIACFGGSAGAGTSLWLATHDDLADPASDDPVLRQSTRISAAACVNGQATYDLVEWQKIIFPFRTDWLANPNEVAEFYGFKDAADLESERGKQILADCSMYGLMSKGDPPVYMSCSMPDGEPKDRNHLLHHPWHVQVIKKRGDEVGVAVEAHCANLNGDAWVRAAEFLLKHLK